VFSVEGVDWRPDLVRSHHQMPASPSSIAIGTAIGVALVGFSKRWFSSSDLGEDHFPHPLDTTSFRTAKLISSQPVGGGAKLLKFKYEGGGFVPIKPFSHVLLRGKTFDVPPEFPFGLKVERPYTPISAYKNEFELLIKPQVHKPPSAEFSSFGLTSRFLLSLETGQTVEVRGPLNSQLGLVPPAPSTPPSPSNATGDDQHQPLSTDDNDLREALLQRKQVGMIVAGSGITPMLQWVKTIPYDSQRRVSILWSNKTKEDLFYVKEMERMMKKSFHADHCKMRTTLTRMAPEGWDQDTGRISKELLRARMPKPSPDCVIVVCGPDSFVQAMAGGRKNSNGKWVGPIGGFLEELDFTNEHVIRL
jgi:NAD(P)H-flavin reductase